MFQTSKFPVPSARRSALKTFPLMLALALVAGLTACGKKEERKVWFGNLNDGAEVESPFTVEMEAQNLVVEPAANGVTDGHGHFHILVDVPASASGEPIPADAQHIHYGMGDTTATLDLPVGDHTLILQFSKGDHVPYDGIRQEIKIRVTHRNIPPAPMADGDDAGEAGAIPPEDSSGGMGVGGGVGVGLGGVGSGGAGH
jgi:hypothetical protein